MALKTEADHVFLGLDQLRGTAALVIAFGHAQSLFGFHPGSGYLAVDLFFALSGFVLSHAYDKRFARGMGAIEFMRIRLIRLYPLYFLGLLIVSIGILANLALTRHPNWTATAFVESCGFALGFLPTPPGIAPRHSIYPLNTPAWSLAFELIVNLAFVLAWRRLSIRCLTAIAGLSAAALAMTAMHYGSLVPGSDWYNVLGGFPRVFFSFTVGVLLLRLFRERSWRIRAGSMFPLATMLLVLCIEPPDRFRAAYDLICVGLIFPIVVLAGATLKPTRYVALYAFFGAISYALYALHFPIFEMTLALLIKLTSGNLGSVQPWAGAGFICLAVGVAYGADIFYDAPVRKWLGKAIPRPAARPA